MSVWQNPPVREVHFRLHFPSLLIAGDAFIGQFQLQRRLHAQVHVQPGSPIVGFRLNDPADPKFEILANVQGIAFIEKGYTDWALFRAKVLDYLTYFPVPTEDHSFIGLAYINRLHLDSYGDGPQPLSKLLAWDFGGPGSVRANQMRHLKWSTDYQMGGKRNQLLRVEVWNTQEADTEPDGVEFVNLTLDRRTVGVDTIPVDAFLDTAHREILDALTSLLSPDKLRQLKQGE